MTQELTLDAPVRYEADYMEFVGDLDGRRQVFRVDADVFRELLQVRRIGEPGLRTLFKADPEHFLFVAGRKLSEQGPSSTPIHLTLADLLR
jgi:hypothetical protein